MSTLFLGQFAIIVLENYRGYEPRPSEWEKLQHAFPTPSSVQQMSGKYQLRRKIASRALERPFVCGCYLCWIMDDMTLEDTPPFTLEV